MNKATELPELRNTFDRFSVWILLRYAKTAASIKLINGKRVHPDLCNFLLAVIWNENEGNPELAILEHHLTKALFESVSENSRKDAIERMMHFFNMLPSKCSTQHYLYITNEWPPIETVASPMILLKKGDLHSIDISNMATSEVCTISAVREVADTITTNVYNVVLCSGQTIHQVLQQIPSKPAIIPPLLKSSSEPTLFQMEAKPVNGIKLQDLTALLDNGGDASMGLFLVRHAKLKDIMLYVKKCCVDRLEDVTPDTWFLVSDALPFETDFPDHSTVHEVAYVTDYGLVFWLRSRGRQLKPVGTHFMVNCWDEYDSVPPAPGWLNILVSNVSDGSTTYLEQLADSAKRTNPFQMIALLQAADMMVALQQPNLSWFDKLCQLLGAQDDLARHTVDTVPLVLLIDHAMAADGSDNVAQLLIQFLNSINDSSIFHRITMWIVGDDVLWTRFATNCKYAAIKYSLPKLEDEEQWKECMSRMVPKNSKVDMEDALQNIMANNGPIKGTPFFGNVFTCAVLLEHIIDHANGSQSYWWIDAMEHYVWKHIASAGSNDLEKLEEDCYERMFRPCTDPTEIFSSQSKIMHRTLQTLLAMRHLAKHPKLIELACFTRVGYNLLDLILFRHSAVAKAVLQHDVEAVRQSSAKELRSVTDCIGRNLLHVVHNTTEITDILLSAEVPLEQRCAAQLHHWTPIQVAIERNDWPLVDRLLAKGAFLTTNETKLQTMAVSELSEIFCDCIADNCTTLIKWILENRPDYQINQRNVYTLSVYEEFDTDLLFRLLTIAQDQGLADREPEPYRYIFGNSALDNAVEDERIELAIFLVERLKFEATDEFNELRAQYEENPKLNEYKLLHKLCREGELAKMQQMIEENGLDPQHEYDGSNVFIQAAASGNLELVQYLFEKHGFDERINDRDQHGCSAMSQALVEGHQPIVQFLRTHNATVKSGWIQHFSNEIVVDDVEIDTQDFLALIACKREKLKQLNIDYNRYEDGELLLHFYIRYVDEPDEDTFRFLLSQYDNVDIRTNVASNLRGGETPLHLAYQNGNKRCREVLLELGADIQAKSLRYGLTTLHYAVMGGADKESLEHLIENHRFDVNTRDARGRTISFYMPLRTELYRWLIERYQFDPCAPDNDGQTVLHHKVIKNSFFARAEIEYLLRTVKISQSHTDTRGRLPLHYAVEAGCREIVRLLLKYRQDLWNIPDSEGLTAAQIAKNLNHSEIVNLYS